MPRSIGFNQEIVLQQVQNLFWEKGYYATSTEDILNTTGLSKSSLYNSFGDKRSLFVLVLNNYLQTTQTFYTSIFSNLSCKESFTQLLLHVCKDNVTTQCYKGCFVSNTAIELATHDQEISQILINNRSYVIGIFKDSIDRGVSKNELHTTINSSAVAQFYFALINGLKVDGKLTTNRQVFDYITNSALVVLDYYSIK